MEEKKCVYIVYGIDCDIYDNYADVAGQPLFMFAFSTREYTMEYLKGKCIEIAKECMDVGSPALMNIPEEQLFIDGATSDIDENIHISYWENDNKAGWKVYVKK